MSKNKKLKKVLALGTATAAAAAYMKKKKVCPICVAKRAMSATRVNAFAREAYDNGVALTPPMGWSSWNTFRHKISEDLILEIAGAMEKSGLRDAGYQYVNIDDCWQSSLRDSQGKLMADLTTFPGGIPSLVRKLNEKGFRAGIYSSNGTLTCEEMPASLGNEALDADTLAEWGIEYFKYDFCHNKTIPTAAPEIDKLIIGRPHGRDELTLQAEDGEARGSARVLQDAHLETGKYVGGLSGSGGQLIFQDVMLPEAGEYVLTVGLRKAGMWEKYAEIVINGEDTYPVTIPSTKGFTHEGRLQVLVQFKEGRNSILIHNPIGSRFDSAAKQYTNMGRELRRATREFAEKHGTEEKPIVYSICEWGLNLPWRWGATAGNLWRTTMDIKPIWPWIVTIYEITARLYKYQCVGGWNDPDMLEVGNGNLTDDENTAHFSLWCMLAAPLILGNDVRRFVDAEGTVDKDNKVLKILTNKDMIAIDQDKRGMQGRKVVSGMMDILAKPLENKELAVCFFNKGGSEANAEIEFAKLTNESFIDLPKTEYYDVFDVWNKVLETKKAKLTATIPPHGVRVFRVRAKN
ncbi:MAG: alpha-galactosidase [Oscillospiraceae bacterium]|jgi:hypothetical protein|nr:alpha-galactosidase [Oscillospiraceae bacterium]